MSWPSSCNNHVKISDMRRLFCLDVMEIKRYTGNKKKKNSNRKQILLFPPIFIKLAKLLKLRQGIS